MEERPSTPPPRDGDAGRVPGVLPRSPLTPEQIRRIETNRLKAKAIREQREAEAARAGAPSLNRTPSGFIAGQKRSHAAITSNTPSTSRDGRANNASPQSLAQNNGIQPARKFASYVEYDFSKMTDTKGGFITLEDDPRNKALRAREEEKPEHMTLKEWERTQLLKKLRDNKVGPFEPGLSVLSKQKTKGCYECGALEIDWKWQEVFKCRVCAACKEKFPEKYSLLTKTEAREDYLLTDPELKDEELLPHLERPNPHKATWNNMMLYLRYQVEAYAFSPKKWGSPEELDAEFEKREIVKKTRKEEKFRSKLRDLKKKTLVESYKRQRKNGGGEFGDVIAGGKHQHEWGRTVDGPDGIGIKKCIECGMEVEELEF